MPFGENLVPVRSRISGAPFPTCVCEVYVPSLACQGVVCAMCTRTLNLSLLGWPKEGWPMASLTVDVRTIGYECSYRGTRGLILTFIFYFFEIVKLVISIILMSLLYLLTQLQGAC